MGIKINHDNTGSQPLEAGWYEVYPTVFDATTAKSSGNKMVVFNYVVRDDVEQAGQGQEIRFDNFVETDAALWRVNAASKAAGIDNDAEFEDIYAWAKEFQGRSLQVQVGHREYNGNKYAEVRAFKESEVGGFLKPSELEKYKNQGNGGNASKPSTTTRAGAEPTAIDIDDDDLPF